jgi:hypothetical protein
VKCGLGQQCQIKICDEEVEVQMEESKASH